MPMLIILQTLLDMLYFKVFQATGGTGVILVPVLSSYVVRGDQQGQALK